MARSKLDDTRDFITLFEYVAGEWTTPPHFHRWTAISLIAACVEDRVWMPFSEHTDTYPNVWVFLIGPSGTGKDHSIRLAQHLLKPEDPLWKVDGKVTMPALYDYLHARQKASGRESAPLFLISSDVTEQLPLGPEAKDFTSRALALYDRQNRELVDLTRTSGDKVVKRPMLNWVGGCTPEWFPLAIDPLIFTSGFAGRGFFVFGEPLIENFHLENPIRRHDNDLVMAHLRERVEAYQAVEGMFVMDDMARTMFEMWRRQQQDRLRNGSFTEVEKQVMNRAKYTIKKLAMIFALSRWTGKGLLLINGDDMSNAISYTETAVIEGVKKVSDFAYATVDSAVLDKVADIIRLRGEIRRDQLLRIATKRGVKNGKHLDELVDTLKQAGHITIDKRRPVRPGGPWPVFYVWKGRKIVLAEKESSEEASDGATES